MISSICERLIMLNCRYANEHLKSHVNTLINMHQLPSEGDLEGWDTGGPVSQFSSGSHETWIDRTLSLSVSSSLSFFLPHTHKRRWPYCNASLSSCYTPAHLSSSPYRGTGTHPLFPTAQFSNSTWFILFSPPSLHWENLCVPKSLLDTGTYGSFLFSH